ncbi:hypothetical protein NBRC116494_27210 [Aurantivibrio plasticivorans]
MPSKTTKSGLKQVAHSTLNATICLPVSIVSALTFAAPTFAIDPPQKESTCQACHGAKGAAPIMESYPKLNGQNQAYLVQALNDYKNGKRSGPLAAIMSGQAAMLSEEEIKALAEYYAAQ